MIKKIGKLLIVLFIIGALVGAFLRTSEQETEIESLEYELSTTRQELRNTKEQLENKEDELLDTREQLTKVADQLNQIRAYNDAVTKKDWEQLGITEKNADFINHYE